MSLWVIFPLCTNSLISFGPLYSSTALFLILCFDDVVENTDPQKSLGGVNLDWDLVILKATTQNLMLFHTHQRIRWVPLSCLEVPVFVFLCSFIQGFPLISPQSLQRFHDLTSCLWTPYTQISYNKIYDVIYEKPWNVNHTILIMFLSWSSLWELLLQCIHISFLNDFQACPPPYTMYLSTTGAVNCFFVI